GVRVGKQGVTRTAEVAAEGDRPAAGDDAGGGGPQDVPGAAQVDREPAGRARDALPRDRRELPVAPLHVARGVQRLGIFVLRVAAPLGELGVLLHQLGRVGQQDAQQVEGGGGTEYGARETFLDQLGQIPAVV